jgi:hypothetical protein
MIEKEETILRKFLSNDQVIVLIQNDILHLVAMAMRAYKNEDTLVKKLTLTDVSQQRELLLSELVEWLVINTDLDMEKVVEFEERFKQ